MHTYVIMYVAIVCKQRSPTFANDHRSICELAREKGEPTKMHHLMMCVSRRGQKKKIKCDKNKFYGLWRTRTAYSHCKITRFTTELIAHSMSFILLWIIMRCCCVIDSSIFDFVAKVKLANRNRS